MAAAVVVQNPAVGLRPDAATALQWTVLYDPDPAAESTTLIAMCANQADADTVAAQHLS